MDQLSLRAAARVGCGAEGSVHSVLIPRHSQAATRAGGQSRLLGREMLHEWLEGGLVCTQVVRVRAVETDTVSLE